MSRPELTGHASLFYDAREARKYDSSSRMVGIQREITERAIELLKLEGGRPSLVLDVGCGSGLSGQVRLRAVLLVCLDSDRTGPDRIGSDWRLDPSAGLRTATHAIYF